MRNTGSTYLTSKHSRTIKKNVLSSSMAGSESAVEMKSKRSLLMALPTTSVSDDKETEFIITNGNAAEHVDSPTAGEPNGDIEKLDLAGDSDTKQPSVEVPPYILERRFMRRYDPALANAPILVNDKISEGEEEEEEGEGEGGEGSLISSEGSTTCYDMSMAELGGELTQMTDIDFSDAEELSHL